MKGLGEGTQAVNLLSFLSRRRCDIVVNIIKAVGVRNYSISEVVLGPGVVANELTRAQELGFSEVSHSLR